MSRVRTGARQIKSAYARETGNWAAQAVAQDIANLVAYCVFILVAMLAGRGALWAYLAWVGLLGYSVYTFAIYVFAVHFGPLFLLYVAVFGLSIYALVVGLSRLDYERVKAAANARRLLESIAQADAGLLEEHPLASDPAGADSTKEAA